jgi:uncharacterized protein YrzB (UPF0473 family)
MSDEFGPDFVSLTDEDGNELELEYVDTLEWNGCTYAGFYPALQGDEDEIAEWVMSDDYGLVILKVIEVDGEEQFSTLDSDEELEAVYEQFVALLSEEDEE